MQKVLVRTPLNFFSSLCTRLFIIHSFLSRNRLTTRGLEFEFEYEFLRIKDYMDYGLKAVSLYIVRAVTNNSHPVLVKWRGETSHPKGMQYYYTITFLRAVRRPVRSLESRCKQKMVQLRYFSSKVESGAIVVHFLGRFRTVAVLSGSSS